MRHLCSALLILFAGAASAAEQPRSIAIRGWQFEFPVLLNQKVTTGPDFTVTYLSSDERKITVGIYEGMHPERFADKKSGVAHEKAKIDGQAASWAVWEEVADTGKEYHAELFFAIEPNAKAKEVFHVFVTASTSSDLSLIRGAVDQARKAKKPNKRAGVDAGFGVLFMFESPWPGTTQHGRYAGTGPCARC